MARAFSDTLSPDLQQWQNLVLGELRLNPALSAPRLRKATGAPDNATVLRVLAAAALDGLYPSMYGHDPTRQRPEVKKPNRKGLVALLESGDVTQAAKEMGNPRAYGGAAENLLGSVLAHYAQKRAAEVERAKTVSLREAKVSDKLTDMVLNELDFEEDLSVGMRGARAELARGLYTKAKDLWDRVMVFAFLDPIDRFTAQMIRALTEAATTAVKDAQLLSGQATDRVEGFVKAFRDMSDDELRSFVNEDVTIRDITQRELGPGTGTELVEEVVEADYTVAG